MINIEKKPKVSIIIPVYNGDNYLKEAIDSAINQNYENKEIIIVNDGSNDNGKTEEIALSYGDKIRYIYKENGGVSSALNYGIKNMNGEYFSWLSHDDKYTPNKLKNLMELLEKNNDKNLIALSGVVHIDKQSRKVKSVPYYFEHNKVYTGSEVIKYMLKYGGLNGCALMIPKNVFEDCGGFNEELRYNQDMLMWYQIFLKGYKLVVDMKNKDVLYRLHEEQASKTRRDLLLHDSLIVTKLLAPIFIKDKEDGRFYLKAFAKRFAKHDCKSAINEVIQIGTESNVLTIVDCLDLRIKLLLGKIRNIIKFIFLHVRLK